MPLYPPRRAPKILGQPASQPPSLTESWISAWDKKVCNSRRCRNQDLVERTRERTETNSKIFKFLKSRFWNRSKAISDIVTKNGVQLFCMKTAQCSKKPWLLNDGFCFFAFRNTTTLYRSIHFGLVTTIY